MNSSDLLRDAMSNVSVVFASARRVFRCPAVQCPSILILSVYLSCHVRVFYPDG